MSHSTDSFVLTVDAGTGSGRALIFDREANQVAMAQREWTLSAIATYPGSAVFDTEVAWSLICKCIQEALSRADIRAEQIKAVTATSMREGMVLYDRDKREIWACPNIDARAGAEANQLVVEGLAERIYETGGDWLGITSPPRFRWIATYEPDIQQRTRYMSMISDWVLLRLSGEIVTDPSCGSSSGLFDLRSSTWSEDLLKRLGLEREFFPQVCQPGTVIGQITRKAAVDTGLVEGTPVVVGGADTQLALLGGRCVRAGQLAVVGGSFWQTAWLADSPLIDPLRRLRTLCFVIPDRWMCEGIGFLNGLAMRWVRDTICDTVAQPATPGEGDNYAAMESLAEAVPAGADGVFALVSDIMNAKRWIQAPTTFVGVDVTKPAHTGRRGKGLLVRAVQESAALTALGHYEILQALSGRKATEIVFCGGASKGRLWPQIVADVFDLPVKIPKVKETTSFGAAFCALVGIGEHASLAEAARELVQWDRVVDPEPCGVAAYREIRDRAFDLQRGLIEWVDTGRLKAMWRGAGAVTTRSAAS